MIETLRDLLLDYGQKLNNSEARKAIEEEIWRQFGAERTVMVLDMSGFSLLTRRHGVVHYLSMVRRMQRTVRPIVLDHGGSMVKFEADNAFAVFPDPESGIRATIEMNQAFAVENANCPEDFAIKLSCGLDHGRILLIEGQEFFGDSVNIACKLGEDLAGPGEILVAKTAMDLLPAGANLGGTPVQFSISGLEMEAVMIDH
jgi:class 3 adenylate cyclase